MLGVLLADLDATSEQLAVTASRTSKVALVAGLPSWRARS